MAKKKKETKYRYVNRVKKAIRRRRPKRLSILTLAGMGAGVMTSINSRDSIYDAVRKTISNTQNAPSMFRDIFTQVLGYDYINKSWHLPTFTTLTLLGSVGSKVANKFVKPSTFDAIPMIGKKIKL